MMRRGFTLVEVLVATVLLGMLVTILTMIFNQSSVAWSTGVASVTALGDMREGMAVAADISEKALPGDDGIVYLVKSVWDDEEMQRKLFERAGRSPDEYERDKSPGRALRTLDMNRDKTNRRDADKLMPEPAAFADPMVYDTGNKNEILLGGNVARGATAYLVGVHSYGPDGETGGDLSWDDITTLPEEVVK